VAENGIPQSVIAFLAEEIDSVLELEVLLLLRESAPQQLCAQDLANTLKIDATWAKQQMEKFATRGILTRVAGAEPCFTYLPSTPGRDAIIKLVADAYATHRVRVVSLIFSKPTSNLKSFADAFRIRRDKTDG